MDQNDTMEKSWKNLDLKNICYVFSFVAWSRASEV